MRKTFAKIGLAAMACMALLSSCFDAAKNEYYYTVSTFATVTRSETGEYRLYLDQGRGIVDPNEKSKDINWGDTKRAIVYYDIPFVDTLYDNTRFKTNVRDAWKIDVVDMVDVTGMDKLPASLGTDTLYAYDFQAYWGYVTLSVNPGNRENFYMTCSYDRDEFKGDTLFLNLHYQRRQGSWNMAIPQTVCAEIPAFVRDAVRSDSLCIALRAQRWYSGAADSLVNDTQYYKVASNRLTPPSYDMNWGGYN